MKKLLLTLIIIILSLSACSGLPKSPGSGSSEPTAATSATKTNVEPVVPTAGSFLAIYEIGLGPEGYVALSNYTNVPTTTKGQYLCQGSDCFALPDAVVEAGAKVKVAVGDGKELENVIAKKATIGELKPSDGEVALFLSDKFDDPKAIVEYIQWGSTPHGLTSLAVEAGLWITTAYAPTTPNATRLYLNEQTNGWVFEESKP